MINSSNNLLSLSIADPFKYSIFCDRIDKLNSIIGTISQKLTLSRDMSTYSPLELALILDEKVNYQQLYTNENLFACLFLASFSNLEATQFFFEKVTHLEQTTFLIFLIGLGKQTLFNVLWDKAKPEVKKGDERGCSWMHYAVIHPPKNEIINHLLENNYDCQQLFNGSTILQLALEENPSDDLLLQKLNEQDRGFSADIELCRQFGHRFSLSGPLFEGFSNKRQLCILQSVIQSFTLAYEEALIDRFFSPKDLQEIQDTWSHSFHYHLDTHFKRFQNETCFIPCYNKNHVMACIFTKNICVKIDTGTLLNHGLNFCRIRKMDEATMKTALSSLFDLLHLEDTGVLNQLLNKSLDLEDVKFIKLEQIVGNCAFQSLKASLLCLLILQKAKEEKELDSESISKAHKKIVYPFNSWVQWDQEKYLVSAIHVMKKYPHIYDLEKIIQEIIQNVIGDPFAISENPLCALINIYPQYKDWQHPVSGITMVRYAFQKRLYELFALLVKNESNLFLKDAAGKTFLDDKIDYPIDEEDKDLIREYAKFLSFTSEKLKFLDKEILS